MALRTPAQRGASSGRGGEEGGARDQVEPVWGSSSLLTSVVSDPFPVARALFHWASLVRTVHCGANSRTLGCACRSRKSVVPTPSSPDGLSCDVAGRCTDSNDAAVEAACRSFAYLLPLHSAAGSAAAPRARHERPAHECRGADGPVPRIRAVPDSDFSAPRSQIARGATRHSAQPRNVTRSSRGGRAALHPAGGGAR